MTRSRYCAAAAGALPQRTAWAAAIAMLVIGSHGCNDPFGSHFELGVAGSGPAWR